MKALILPVVMLALGVGAGIGAGLILAPPPEDESGAAEEALPLEEVENRDAPLGDGEFARMNNQFIVPVVKGDAVVALVVMSITLEVDPGGTEQVFSKEPRLRDRFLRVLFDHANIGGFDAGFTQSGNMSLLRRNLQEAAESTLGKIVRDVLIIDIVRQEV